MNKIRTDVMPSVVGCEVEGALFFFALGARGWGNVGLVGVRLSVS